MTSLCAPFVLVAIPCGCSGTQNTMTIEIKKYCSLFLFVWNAVGVGVTTFGYPFAALGFTPNGYFGVWVSLAVSGILLAQVVAPTKINERTRAAREKIRAAWDKFQEATMLAILLLASLVVLVVGAIQCGETECNKIVAFGVAFGVINLGSSSVFFYLNKREPEQYHALPHLVLLISAVWWVTGFLALTLFVNQFSGLGNGYLSALLGTIAAVNLAAAKRKQMYHHEAEESVVNNANTV